MYKRVSVYFYLIFILSSQLNSQIGLDLLNPDELIPDNTGLSMDMIPQEINRIVLEEAVDPNEYIVGPGDRFLFNMVSADGTVNIQLDVSPLGDVLIPVVGIVKVKNLTLFDAFTKIRQYCLTRYGNALVYITLSRIREFKVLVKGMVEKPGYVVVNPYTRVSEVVEMVNDGVDEAVNPLFSTHSLRNIKLHRGDETIRVDLVKFNISGDKEFNPRIQESDVISISLIENEVGLYGGVKVPGKYEYVINESLQDLIEIAGGFTDNADSSNIEITRFISDTEKDYIRLHDVQSIQATTVAPEDHIIVRLKHDYKQQDLVSITGEIKYPGKYSIIPGEATIGAIIQKAGGFAMKADKTKIMVNNLQISQLSDIELDRILLVPVEDRSDAEQSYLKARSRTAKGTISSSSLEYTNNIMSYPVQINDQIIIPELHEYVELLGAVKYPGRYPLIPGKSADDYIKDAGDITSRASRDRYLVKNSTGQRLPFDDNPSVENGDIIFIAEKLEYNRWTRFREIMTVGGQMAALIMVIQNAVLR